VNERQFLWGLSNGVTVFAIAGAFWLGLGIGIDAIKIGGLACALFTVLQVGICAALLWAAVRLRRRSGFRGSELRQGVGAARRRLSTFWPVSAGPWQGRPH
jgi:hypothetical protein